MAESSAISPTPRVRRFTASHTGALSTKGIVCESGTAGVPRHYTRRPHKRQQNNAGGGHVLEINVFWGKMLAPSPEWALGTEVDPAMMLSVPGRPCASRVS